MAKEQDKKPGQLKSSGRPKHKGVGNSLLDELDAKDGHRPLSRVRLQDALLTLAAMSDGFERRGPRKPKPDDENEADLRLAVLLLERSARRQRKAAVLAADELLFDALYEYYVGLSVSGGRATKRWPRPAVLPSIGDWWPVSLADGDRAHRANLIAPIIARRHWLAAQESIEDVTWQSVKWALDAREITSKGGPKTAAAKATADITGRLGPRTGDGDDHSGAGTTFLRPPSRHRRHKQHEQRPPEGDMGTFFGAPVSRDGEPLQFVVEAIGGRLVEAQFLALAAGHNLRLAGLGDAKLSRRLPMERHGHELTGLMMVPESGLAALLDAAKAQLGNVGVAMFAAILRRANQGIGLADTLCAALASACGEPLPVVELAGLWEALLPCDRTEHLRAAIERAAEREGAAVTWEPYDCAPLIHGPPKRWHKLIRRFDHDRAAKGRWVWLGAVRPMPPEGDTPADQHIAALLQDVSMPDVAFIYEQAGRDWTMLRPRITPRPSNDK